MSAGDLLKADETEAANPEEAARQSHTDAAKPDPENVQADSHESDEDDAWLEACREETAIVAEDDEAPDAVDEFEEGVAALSADLERLRQRNDEPEIEAALADLEKRIAAMEKTGNDAMSTLGQAMNAIAERIDDLEESREHDAFAAAAERASPTRREAAVAPYIENAERELQAAKDGGAVDIFDRIAQAAESQFDESRGSTAKRVSKLVDDRRVGTKRWTPSKTVKARMEKLEAARRAAEESAKTAEAEVDAAAETVAAKAADTAATAEAPVAAEPAQAASTAEKERVVISRRQKQAAAEESPVDEPVTGETASEDAAAEALDEHDDADALRIVPGARGRRRDRARKSRLDEDFEKIFEDDGTPSIGSLRRKLRTGASEADETDTAAGTETADSQAATETSVTEETFGAQAAAAPAAKAGLMAKLFKRKPRKAAPAAKDADETVEAFEADEFSEAADLASAMDDAEPSVEASAKPAPLSENQRRQKQIVVPIIVSAVAIIAGCAGYFLYKFLL